jgi:hypothetical protein
LASFFFVREEEGEKTKRRTQVSTCLQIFPFPSKVRIEVPVKASLGLSGPGMSPPPATVISMAHLQVRGRKREEGSEESERVREFFVRAQERRRESPAKKRKKRTTEGNENKIRTSSSGPAGPSA